MSTDIELRPLVPHPAEEKKPNVTLAPKKDHDAPRFRRTVVEQLKSRHLNPPRFHPEVLTAQALDSMTLPNAHVAMRVFWMEGGFLFGHCWVELSMDIVGFIHAMLLAMGVSLCVIGGIYYGQDAAILWVGVTFAVLWLVVCGLFLVYCKRIAKKRAIKQFWELIHDADPKHVKYEDVEAFVTSKQGPERDDVVHRITRELFNDHQKHKKGDSHHHQKKHESGDSHHHQKKHESGDSHHHSP